MKLALSLRNELLRSIPDHWRESFGGDCYEQYLKLRLRFLNARVERHGSDYGIEYMVVDQGRAEKIVFLPGFADSKENFYNAAQFLVRDYDILVPDLPGFGRSFKHQDETYNLRNYGRWMQDFLKAVNWTDFHLVGNSLGAAVAAELTLLMPERIKSLTLVDSAGIVLPQQPSIYQEFLSDRNIFDVRTPMQFRYLLDRVYHVPPVIPPFVFDHLFKVFAANADWHKKLLSDLLEGVQRLDDPKITKYALNRRLRDIRVPTMIVWGDEDTLFPRAIADFARQEIPGSVLYLLPDRGHAPQVEAPLQFAQLLKKFIRRQPVRS